MVTETGFTRGGRRPCLVLRPPGEKPRRTHSVGNIHFPFYGKNANYENTTVGNRSVACRRIVRRHGHGAGDHVVSGAATQFDSTDGLPVGRVGWLCRSRSGRGPGSSRCRPGLPQQSAAGPAGGRAPERKSRRPKSPRKKRRRRTIRRPLTKALTRSSMALGWTTHTSTSAATSISAIPRTRTIRRIASTVRWATTIAPMSSI